MRRVRHARDPQVGVPLSADSLPMAQRVGGVLRHGVPAHVEHSGDLGPRAPGAASIDRISFTVSRGTVISSILPGRARQSNRLGKPYGEGRAPGSRGAALLLKLLNFSCSRYLFPSEHSDHFLVNINIQGRLRRDRRQPLERRARGRG